MNKWGNKKARSYWEANVPDEVYIPDENDTVQVIERWIRDKYEHKKYVKGSGKSSKKSKKDKKKKKKKSKKESESSSEEEIDSDAEEERRSAVAEKKSKAEAAATAATAAAASASETGAGAAGIQCCRTGVQQCDSHSTRPCGSTHRFGGARGCCGLGLGGSLRTGGIAAGRSVCGAAGTADG